ncbi:unnamed protein product [Fraxinus pennsylvanica]|uniref:Aminotransferase class I/classII large domain-containing protein n=1 Tax=Fraxinus pennsylvanica TaxID=56036 RepID=A0AAD1ZR41_9LAMI|nr:unnamed protein product [Fraxinus pennsylvanica]
MEANSCWDSWVEEALSKLESLKLLRSLRPIYLPNSQLNSSNSYENFEFFSGPHKWDRSSVEVIISEATFQKWLHDIPSLGNDYLGLSSHPTVSNAAIKAAREHGMGPRGSALICGYTNYHRLLESSLADLKRKEDCLLCPTGLSANMAFITAVGNVGSLLAGGKPSRTERIAIFSDALNHASIIDGIRLAEKQGSVVAFVYKHCDMHHLDALLSKCPMKKRVVVTDSLFSMDGDFAPMTELVKLRTLSKAAGCHGGFIACSKKWKLLIQSRGRSFIFSTSTPVPVVAAAHAAVSVAKEERWRRRAIWNRVRDFQALTGIPVTSPIISLVVGSEEKAIQASRHLLKLGFHITAIRPPTVPPNSCRLRITLSAVHTLDDLRKLTNALSHCVNFQEIEFLCTNLNSKL